MARFYKTINSYHLSYQFVLQLYDATKTFPKSEEQNILSQIRRASVSIPLNIVEGSCKASPKEFVHFLNISFASTKEVEVLLQLSHDLGYLSKEKFESLNTQLDEVCAKLFLFTRNIEARINDRNPKFRFFQEFKKETTA
jgi:four helix bundle protein